MVVPLSPMSKPEQPKLKSLDVAERGAPRDGAPQVLERRLFMQLLVLHCGRETSPRTTLDLVASRLEAAGTPGVLYEDVNDPSSFALLTWAEDPAHFVTHVRPHYEALVPLRVSVRSDFTMLGRTYASGHEQDLEYWILRRPRETVLNPAWRWAVWYPLRRSGAFERLDAHEQAKILREHATIGRAYGEQDLAHDVRLACHGLDARDNEFVIGLVGKDLHPLSHVVQTMRHTRQTSEFIVQMGPFFVGHVAWASAGK